MNRDPGVAAKPKASSVRTGRVVMCTSANRQHQEFDVRAPRFSSRGNMNSRIAIVAAVACFASAPSTAQTFSFDPLKDLESAIPAGVPNESRILQARLQVKEMAQDALASLYETSPWTRRSIEKAAGYAVFSTFGLKLLFAGGTTGKGVVVNNRTGRQTFMKMIQVQGGLGFGVNQNRLIFVFANESALRNFI